MEAQKLLDNAMYYERRKSWKKAIYYYDELQKTFTRNNAFKKLNPAAQEKMEILQFQCYFHCATAHQKLCNHDMAVSLYNKAMKPLQKTKSGSRKLGYIRGKHIHWCVPAYARKSFSEIHLGELYEALKSAESALVLDVSNSDILCIRALVRFLSMEMEKAIKDVSQAIKIHSSHVCSLLLRSLFSKQLEQMLNVGGVCNPKSEWSEDEEKAYEINPSIVAYYNCSDIKEKFMEIFEKYLPTIRCCHTVTVYDVLQISQETAQRKQKRFKEKILIPEDASAWSMYSSLVSSSSIKTSNAPFQASTTARENSGLTSTYMPSIEWLDENEEKMNTDNSQESKASETECCKHCNSMEGFLKNLIHGGSSTNKQAKKEIAAKRPEVKEYFSQPVRMYPRPWVKDQQFTTIPVDFSTRRLKTKT